MSLLVRRFLSSVALLLSLSCFSLAFAQDEELRLLGRSVISGHSTVLDEPDWKWLLKKQTLRLGTSSPDYPPFVITSDSGQYEGITADYAKMIGDLLHINIEVIRYKSRPEVLAALKNGEIDFLGTANGFEMADAELALSQDYAADQPTLVTRIGDAQNLSADLAGKRVAMLYHYLPPETIKRYYPKAIIQLYPSTLSAIGAVAFGQADVYLGDSISSNYLINKNYLNNVQLSDFSKLEVQPFSFAVRRQNQRLLEILNRAIATIPSSERMSILRRWNGGGAGMPGRKLLQLSGAERRWMLENPIVKVAINEDFLPLTFIDENGKFRGISADLLEKVGQLTGLKFHIQRANSVSKLTELINDGKADMLAALTPSEERESSLRFTRPYLSNPFVLISPVKTETPRTMDQMAGARLALIDGNTLREYILDNYPEVKIVQADNAFDAMEKVNNGEVEGAINSLISAKYLISRHYRDRLQISTTVGTLPARIAFATDRGSLELYSILDKALLSITPEEMDELTNRWRNDLLVGDSYWLRNRVFVIQGFIVFGVLLITALGWIGYLRLLMRKRKQAELALSDQLEFMRVLIDGTPHPIYIRDHEGRLVTCNAAYLQVFQVDPKEVIGRLVTEGVLSDLTEATSFQEDYLHVMNDGLPRIGDRTLTLEHGQVLTIYHWMLPYRNSDGQVRGMIAGWIDISDRQHLLLELKLAKDSADDANKAKTTFLATMSHEIRTPMNAVIGMLELALKKADQGVLDRVAIEVASGAARGLLDLIGDILDIARIESGRLSLSPERANLRELIESVFRVFEGLARQKQVDLELDLKGLLEDDVMLDPLRFKQILSNILSNAIKFTDKGVVRLSVESAIEHEDKTLSLVVLVEDSGRGISVEDQRRLFSPFIQASNQGNSNLGGSGLGLVISRTLCEMMGGTLSMHSTLGKGTCIEIILQLPVLEPRINHPCESKEFTSTGNALNILVIDDYPANRLLLSQQLSFLGHRVTDAVDGAHGLRAWRKETFDAVITDCNMPVMSGYEMVRAIREEEFSKEIPRTLVLGFTANATADEKARCLKAGMDDCLFKPISLQDLNSKLSVIEPTNDYNVATTNICCSGGEVNLSGLQDLTRDQNSIKELLKQLISSLNDDMLKLLRLFAQNDLSGLADLAHRVKGGANIIKAVKVIGLCEALESASQSFDSAVLTAAVNDLQNSMEELCTQLGCYINSQ